MTRLRLNRPSVPGVIGGAMLARIAEGAIDELQAAGVVDVPERCASCAFRAGTLPNGCLPTVGDAMKCVIEHQQFMCHQDKAGDTPCAGWLSVLAALGPEAKPGVAPWPFSYDGDEPQKNPSDPSCARPPN